MGLADMFSHAADNLMEKKTTVRASALVTMGEMLATSYMPDVLGSLQESVVFSLLALVR